MRDFNLPPKIQEWLVDLVCKDDIGDEICANIAFLLCGYDKAQLNEVCLGSGVDQVVFKQRSGTVNRETVKIIGKGEGGITFVKNGQFPLQTKF